MRWSGQQYEGEWATDMFIGVGCNALGCFTVQSREWRVMASYEEKNGEKCIDYFIFFYKII